MNIVLINRLICRAEILTQSLIDAERTREELIELRIMKASWPADMVRDKGIETKIAERRETLRFLAQSITRNRKRVEEVLEQIEKEKKDTEASESHEAGGEANATHVDNELSNYKGL